ncbi:transforming growth factor-beta-induced protein ig-h3 [Octopus bimaculoides]|nr:transforming growth factor-beta-induced protein ig-h3 [Octopus bimaculoides]
MLEHHILLSYFYFSPNVCAVQEVTGTGDRYFPKCLARRVLRLCGRSTFVRLQCCPGYEKVRGQPGCAASLPLENLTDTAENLRLQQFHSHAKRPNFRRMLSPNQAYTIFVPNDEAFSESIRTSGYLLSFSYSIIFMFLYFLVSCFVTHRMILKRFH